MPLLTLFHSTAIVYTIDSIMVWVYTVIISTGVPSQLNTYLHRVEREY